MRNVSGDHAALLFRFFIPYALILLGSLWALWFAYAKTSAVVENESVKSTLAALNQIQEAFDGRLAEIETIARQLSSESKILSFQFVNEPFGGTRPYQLWDLEKSLFNYRLVNHFIVDYYVAYKNSGMILSPRKVYADKQYYNLQLHYEGMKYEDWRHQLFGEYHYKTYLPERSIMYERKTYSVVTYMQSFGLKGGGGVIAVMLDNKQIQNMLRKLTPGQGGFAYIADPNGNIISSIGLDQRPEILKALPLDEGDAHIRLTGQEMLVTRAVSPLSGWSFVSAQPKQLVLEKVYEIKRVTMAVFLSALLLGLALAVYFADRSSRPILRILRLLPKPPSDSKRSSSKHSVEFIGYTVSALIENHDSLKKRLAEQIPLLRSVFMDRLLKGGYPSQREIDAAMEHSQLTLRGSQYAVAMIRIRGYEGPFVKDMLKELDIIKIKLQDCLHALYGETILSHDLGENRLALVFAGSAGDAASSGFEPSLRSWIQEVYERLIEIADTGLCIAVGGSRSQVTELYRSFGEAQFVLHHAEWNRHRPIQFYDDMEPATFTYYYPADEELRLIQLVKSGNLNETRQLLEQIKEKNGREGPLPLAVERLLAHELCGTLMKCCPHQRPDHGRSEAMEALHQALDPHSSPSQAMNAVCRAIIQLCMDYEESKKSRNDRLTKLLLDYIEEHFRELDLSLSVLAREAQTSEAYASYFFKEQTGWNFSDYVEHLRMNEAKQQLSHTDRPVSDIAAAVGYLSLNTFSRAFKRANGISATEYRRISRGGSAADLKK